MTARPEILYLSDQDVMACGCTQAQINDAMENVFRMKHAGLAGTAGSMQLTDAQGNRYQAKNGTLAQPPFTCVKWYGYFGGNSDHSLPVFNPLIVLNEGRHGFPVAIMNGAWISEVRTASITALAAKYMARPDSRRVAFIGCGAQARSHLQALRAVFDIDEVFAHSRTLAGARKFVDEMAGSGISGHAFEDPREALQACDIIISTVPRLAPGNQFLRASWVPKGAFVGMMDLGFGWQASSLTELDRLVTDDLQAMQSGDASKLNYSGPLIAGLAEIVSGAVVGRLSEEERNGIIFGGTGLADLAAAVLVYESANAKGIGRRLPP